MVYQFKRKQIEMENKMLLYSTQINLTEIKLSEIKRHKERYIGTFLYIKFTTTMMDGGTVVTSVVKLTRREGKKKVICF